MLILIVRNDKKGISPKEEGSPFTEEEKNAMKERLSEMKRKKSGKDMEKEVLDKIEKMEDEDKEIAMKIHNIMKEYGLIPRTWYGMPAYAKDDNLICFFQHRKMFKARYSVLGFTDKAKLDNGKIWAVSYAITSLSSDVESTIRELVKKAISIN